MGTREPDEDPFAGTLAPGDTPAHGAAADPLAVTVAGSGESAAATTGPAHVLGPGTRLGRYVVQHELGAGGMGVVYAAHDPDLDRPVAIKVLRAELNVARGRLVREGQAIARLRHPNLITVHDIGIHDHELFIAMELVRGGTLGAWMRAGEHGRRPWREVLERLIPAGRGLAAAHAAGLVHRDFKPENVLLGEDGRVVVTDFGLAQLGDGGDTPVVAEGSSQSWPAASAGELTRTGAVLGTPAYMSPEQFRGERPDARSDQFSFCVSLFEALFGARPFEPQGSAAPSVTALASAVSSGRIERRADVRDVPRWLRRALARGLQADPAARWPSMDALLAALRPPRRARLAVAVALAAGAVVAASLALAGRAGGAPVAGAVGACDAAAAELAAVWPAGDGEARAAYRARHPGAPWLAEEEAWLDGYVGAWSTRRRLACLASGADVPADASITPCLRAARDAVAAAVARTVGEWPELPALDACARPAATVVPFPVAIGLGPQGVAQLAPDGQRVVVSNFAEPPYVFAADPAAFAPRPVDGAYLVGDWLPDGRVVAQRADASLFTAAPDGRDAAPLVGRGDLLHTQINVVSPGGDRVVVQEDDAIAVLAARDGARLHVVAGPAHEVAWEPDGRRLAIVSRDLHALKLLDTRSGAVVSHPLRLHTRGLGEVGLAWLAPGRLLLSGSAAEDATYAVFELRLDDASALRGPPVVRWRAADAMMVRLFDAAGGRVLVELATSRQRLFRWRDGRAAELPSAYVGLRVTAYDRARGEALAFGPGQLVRFDVDRFTRTVAPGDGHVLPTLHAGRAVQVEPRGHGTWALVELGGLGAGAAARDVLTFAWPAEHGAPHVRCSPLATERCVLASRDGRALHVAALGARGPAAPVVVPEPSWNPDVSRDGRRVLVPTVGGDLLDVDVATGAATTVTHVDPACRLRTVRWIDDGPRAWVVLLCPDRFAIARVGPGEAPEEIVRTDGWISGVEAMPDGGVLYSVMDWDPQLAIVDGL